MAVTLTVLPLPLMLKEPFTTVTGACKYGTFVVVKVMMALARFKLYNNDTLPIRDTSKVPLVTETDVLLEMVPEPAKASVPALTVVLPV